MKTARIGHVMLGAVANACDLLGGEGAHRLGGAAQDHGAVREFLAFGDQGTSAHQTVLADFRAVEYHRTDANQGFVTNRAAMQHGFVPHRDVAPHHQRLTTVSMQHAAILDIAARTNVQMLAVATGHHAKPHAGLGLQCHLANHLGAIGYPGGVGNLGCHAIQLINRHGALLFSPSGFWQKFTIVEMELRTHALEVLRLSHARNKAQAAQQMLTQAHHYHIDPHTRPNLVAGVALPGHPQRPQLRRHTEVARRSPATLHGRVVLMHAIAHIEFNAINLALDAIWRFDGLPAAFYLDWLQVAAEEGKHFVLIEDWLQAQGHAYGDFPAHQGLWAMCEKTADDIVARMALVPRTLEARGLDATPQIQRKLHHVGTPDALAAVAILDTILTEEIGHVAIGNHWYRWLCAQRGLEPVAHYAALTARYQAPRPKPPLNTDARMAAGFTEEELQWLHMEPEPAPPFNRPIWVGLPSETTP